MPPSLELDRLQCRATIDFLTVSLPKRAAKPAVACTVKFSGGRKGSVRLLTLHDPKAGDIRATVLALDNPLLTELELSVDFLPRPGMAPTDREQLLNDTFVALAARFRPEDMTSWGYGPRGGLTGPKQKPLPFHQRLPAPTEVLIYGSKGSYMQSKLYLKRVDQRSPLPVNEHRVRLELTIRRWGLVECGLEYLGNLLGYPWRSKFTKHFRIVASPAIRGPGSLTAKELHRRTLRMNRAWRTAGVGKFAVNKDLPLDTDLRAVQQIKTRSKRQLPMSEYRLIRDQVANARIGDAMKNLERKLT